MTPKKTLLVAALALAALPAFAQAPADAKATLKDIETTLGFVPDFLKALPADALPGTWEEMKGLQMNPNTAIPVKIKELIGLAVSAQIPCRYCVLAHTEFAKANGATKEEVGTAVGEASLSRHWSTFINGTQVDERKFRAEVATMVGHLKSLDPKAPPPKAIAVTDATTAYQDIEQTFGSVPSFMRNFPSAALPGAWKAMRGIEMSPTSTLAPKYVSLMGLAVSSQIPCHYCIVADTEFAKLNGASELEINEAVAMAAFTRQMSTLLNGLQINEARFKADIAKLVKPKGKQLATR